MKTLVQVRFHIYIQHSQTDDLGTGDDDDFCQSQQSKTRNVRGEKGKRIRDDTTM